jgi:hypothetical protein
MAAPWNPPKRGEDFEFVWYLEDYANPGNWKSNPTLAAGDFQISKDGGAFANLNTLPTVSPASGRQISIVLSATEMTADKVSVQMVDQTVPKEWADSAAVILTTA